MVATLIGGPLVWGGERDDEGHRTYMVTRKVKAHYQDGPNIVMNTSGLPSIGSAWSLGNDSDTWAFCTPYMRITPFLEQDKNIYWRVEQKFTTKPLTRTSDGGIEDPLLEPQKVSGGFVKYVKEVEKDRNGDLITNSSHEQITGSNVEFDHNRPTVHIEQNVLFLALPTLCRMIDTVNGNAMWGLSPRKVKLSNISWERKFYAGLNVYYTRIFDFDIKFDTFDRSVLDAGYKVISGRWLGNLWIPVKIDGEDPDPEDPSHFIEYRDRQGNPSYTILNGEGKPYSKAAGDELVYNEIEYYRESNFLSLGIPSSF
jgi:hypothetical protein